MLLPWAIMVSLWIRIEMRLRIAHGAVVFKAMPILADDLYRSLRREGFELHIAPNRSLIRQTRIYGHFPALLVYYPVDCTVKIA